jgi:hypothetical protein
MKLSELKELGPPFHAAEIQVSVLNNFARLVLVLRNPTLDFPLGENVKGTVDEIIRASKDAGLIDESTRLDVIDLDMLPN